MRAQKPLSMFYGYPAELIARWCGVTVATASAWKAGTAKPSRPALRLFTLYREERVLGPEWRGLKVHGSRLIDPTGKSLSVSQIEHYENLLQFMAELARQNPADRVRYEQFLDLLLGAG